jgi:hypothetical protein
MSRVTQNTSFGGQAERLDEVLSEENRQGLKCGEETFCSLCGTITSITMRRASIGQADLVTRQTNRLSLA